MSTIDRQPAVAGGSPAATPAPRSAGVSMPGRSTTGWWSLGAARLLVHRHDPEGPARGVVVVVAPPSNEALTTHRTERVLAARLVDAGFAVVRTGLTDASTSALVEPDDRPVVQRWEDEVVAIADHAAELYGAPSVDLVSTRLGATLALNAARRTTTPVRVVAALAPVGSGRQYLRAMSQLLAIASADVGLPAPFSAEADGSVATFGMTLDRASADHLRGYGLHPEPVPGLQAHLFGSRDKPFDKAVRTYAAASGATVHEVGGLGAMLDRMSSYALVPRAVVDAAVEVVVGAADDAAPVSLTAPEPDATSAVVAVAPRRVVCDVEELFGAPVLVTRPEGADPERVLVWSPGATEPSDGPTGLWAHMATRLAPYGVATVRFDLLDAGERTFVDRWVDVYPYEHERVAEMAEALRWAQRRFGVVPDVGGLCAGAWLALAAAAQVPVRTAVPVNCEQWTLEPTVIERHEADPETGLPNVPEKPPVLEGKDLLSRPRVDKAVLARTARDLLKTRMPYPARVELGRRNRIQAVEPVLDAVTRHGAVVRALLSERDCTVFTDLHGYQALRSLKNKGREIHVEADAATDHGMVAPYTRERVVEFVVRAVAGRSATR